jgi:L-threonylcarbamoyladenylate synthase
MRIVRVDPQHPSPSAIDDAAAILRSGGLVAFPTETVYGLGADALSAGAVQRIYRAKGRPSYNPIIVHVAHRDDISRIALDWPTSAARLADMFWPGPLTLVLPKRAEVPDAVSAGLPTVAIRVPAHPVAHALLTAARIPVAAPSANRSSMLSPTSGAHVAKSLGDEVDMILDAGPSPVGIESTVLDLTSSVPTILRPGSISRHEIEAIIGRVDVVTRFDASQSDAPRPSPGMLDRHYAPRAKLLLVDPAMERTRSRIETLRREGLLVGALTVTPVSSDAATIVRMPDDPAAYAARLYEMLHALDDAGCDVILVERVPNTVAWDGIRDRLERAAAQVL